MSSRTGIRAALLAVIALFGPSAPSEARIVSADDLSRYCAEEAMVRLDASRSELIILPVEQNRGQFTVNVQLDGRPGMVECRFDRNRKLLGVAVSGAGKTKVAHKAGPAAPKAALNKCLYTFGQEATVEKVSPLRPGYSEIILRADNGSRRVACTVPDDGHEISDWVEMKP
ncbi:hypothetical protein [Rhodobacter sp. CZR27]|uniref:hypothetical protein n=1 Tax=Rhodobacter sp. CZR27 TaxID=2033869 RepID=UPI000BBEEC31|nr:hypothetical protein [Rhodobacter sp. CZR27]